MHPEHPVRHSLWHVFFLFSALFFVFSLGTGAASPPDLPPLPSGRYVAVLEGSSVKAFVRSTLHDFDAVASKFSGEFVLAGDRQLSSARFHFEFTTADMGSGNFLRDGAMRDLALEAEKFPKAEFDAEEIRFLEKKDGEWRYRVTGVFVIHGVRKKMTIPVAVRQKGKRFILQAKFTLRLSAYKIVPPSLPFISVEDLVEVKVRLAFRLSP